MESGTLSAKADEIRICRLSVFDRLSMRVASLTAEPMTVKSSRLAVPISP